MRTITDQRTVGPDTDVHTLDLRDADGTGYRMEYTYGESISIQLFEAGRTIHDETIKATSRGQLDAIEYMLTTARSVGEAIEDDEADGYVGEAFVDGFATLVNRFDMDFHLLYPRSNEWVLCTLKVADRNDSHRYETIVAFGMRSTDLRAASRHLEALLL